MLIGHLEQQTQFLKAVAGGRIHHAWLLVGPQGIGKRRFADMAALRLLAGPGESFEVSPEHPAARLIMAGSHLDHRVLTRQVDEKGREAGEIRIEQVRALQALFRTTPGLGAWRTVIVDSIDDMNRAAANAFLKSLEEPPADTIFFLVSHAPARLLPTIRSRCRTLRFRKLEDAAVRQVLREQAVPDANLDELVALADGSPGEALRFSGVADGLSDAMEQVVRGGDVVGFARGFQAQSAQARLEALAVLTPRRLALTARKMPIPQAFALYEEADILGRDAVKLAYDRVQVAFALGRMLARAGQIEGANRQP